MSDEDATVYPTHSCFDDVVDYFNNLAASGATWAELEAHTIINAILIAPDGERFAHAWIELGDEIIQGGIYKGERWWIKMTRAEFEPLCSVETSTRYTLEEAMSLQAEHGPGPWAPEYQALCRVADRSPPRSWKVG